MPQKTKAASAEVSTVIGQMKGTAKNLARLVQEHATYEFEDFKWLPATIEGIAGELDVTARTIWRVIQNPPFHYITRNTEDDGRHILLKLGTEPCETDHVFRLRAIWAEGIIHFNAIAADVWSAKLLELVHREKGKTFSEGKKKPSDRLRDRIAATEKSLPEFHKLKAGKKVSLQVSRVQIGQLRGIVQALGDDAHGTVARLVTFDGWHAFSAYLKAEKRLTRFYHWPHLGTIMSNLDIALQTYLDALQDAGKIDPAESAQLLATIADLQPIADA